MDDFCKKLGMHPSLSSRLQAKGSSFESSAANLLEGYIDGIAAQSQLAPKHHMYHRLRTESAAWLGVCKKRQQYFLTRTAVHNPRKSKFNKLKTM